MPGRNELEEDLKILKERKNELDKTWIPVRSAAREVQLQIENTERAIRIIDLNPRVSDHALFRYLQRKFGVDFDAIREEILTENVKAAIKAGAASITVDGYKYMITEGCITTILAPGQVAIPRKVSS